MQLFPQARDRFGIGALADHLLHRIARRDVEQQKHDHQDSEERRNRERSLRTMKASTVYLLMVTSVQRWPLKTAGTVKPLSQGWTAYMSL